MNSKKSKLIFFISFAILVIVCIITIFLRNSTKPISQPANINTVDTMFSIHNIPVKIKITKFKENSIDTASPYICYISDTNQLKNFTDKINSFTFEHSKTQPDTSTQIYKIEFSSDNGNTTLTIFDNNMLTLENNSSTTAYSFSNTTFTELKNLLDVKYYLHSSALEKPNDEEIKKNDSLAAAMNKLHQFQVFENNPNKTKPLFDILNGVVVIDLSGYDSDIQSLIVAITLDLFYVQMQAAGSSKLEGKYRQLTKLILVDEADNFMSEGFLSLKKILKEGREFGVGTILSTQFLKHFGSGDDDYAKYILTWIVHNVADLKTSDVDFVFKTESKSIESQRLFNDIKQLEKHHSIVKISSEKPKYIRDRAFWELYNDLKSN